MGTQLLITDRMTLQGVLCAVYHTWRMTYPQEMAHNDREADGQGSRAQAAISPLICYGEDADDQLQREEHLHGGGHAQADARLQLYNREEVREKQETDTQGDVKPSAVLGFHCKTFVRRSQEHKTAKHLIYFDLLMTLH